MSALALPALDLGCGTGVGGVDLANLGVTTIDGLNISAAMLAHANQKGRDHNLPIEAITQTLSYPTAAYDAAICVVTFTHTHVGPRRFKQLIRAINQAVHSLPRYMKRTVRAAMKSTSTSFSQQTSRHSIQFSRRILTLIAASR
jgi:cyclopropane fatty-acyl-phospholipid synthase-like methyltransferase